EHHLHHGKKAGVSPDLDSEHIAIQPLSRMQRETHWSGERMLEAFTAPKAPDTIDHRSQHVRSPTRICLLE
ncbi:hypothetical protein, partial [Caballeronia sp. INML3]|uniref:hypothetical protein n=1 Tax=Caballeronia sp. INML3 TaxID=2921752 RepID=UPI0020324D10